MSEERVMTPEEQSLICYIMEDHFVEMMEDDTGGIRSQYAREETQAFSIAFEEAGLPMPTVEAVSRIALRRAAGIHAVKNVSPEDFL
ncbi:MAG: hypothetical protein WA843_02985 [Candidatus Saccharimonadales bacterium]